MRRFLPLVLAAALVVGWAGCGDDLQSADSDLEIECVEQPNADPVCIQGSGVQVEPVSEGDSCDGGEWRPISDYEADQGLMVCE